VPSEIEVPRRPENEYQVHQRAAAQQDEGRLNQASETAASPALRQFVAKCVATAHGMGRVVPNIFSPRASVIPRETVEGSFELSTGTLQRIVFPSLANPTLSLDLPKRATVSGR
jgi:hypothetical protein